MPGGRPLAQPLDPDEKAALVRAHAGGYLDQLLIGRTFMSLAVRLAAEESAAIAKSRQEVDAKVKARIKSGGRKPSNSDLSKGQAERPLGGVFSWQHWDPVDHESP